MLFLFQKGEERCYSVAKSCPTLCDPMDCMGACQASLAFIVSWSLLKLMSIDSVMPSNHLILCCHLLLSSSIFPHIRVSSNESALHIRWPKYWSFKFSISPSNEYSGLKSFVYKTDMQEDRLYSTGNYIQYLIITYHGKESEKEYIYICITESLLNT